jgi:hypothetical protein
MRRLTIILMTVLVLTFATAGSALGHVHGVTPLNCAGLTTENANSGGNGTNGTPADDANGGPIAGIIPTTTGNASFTPGPDVAGKHSTLCD